MIVKETKTEKRRRVIELSESELVDIITAWVRDRLPESYGERPTVDVHFLRAPSVEVEVESTIMSGWKDDDTNNPGVEYPDEP